MTAARRARRRLKVSLSRRDDSKAPLIFLKITCQVKVRSEVEIEHFRILVLTHLRTVNSTQTGPNSAETLSKVRRRYCMGLNFILCAGKGQGQVTKSHYSKVTFGSFDTCFMTYFGHIIPWLRLFGRLRPFLEVSSEGQVKVRSKKVKFSNL